MKYLLTAFFISTTFFGNAQTGENINQDIFAQYYSTEVLNKTFLTEGKSVPYFFVLKWGPNGGAVAIDVSKQKIDYGEKYPIVAKITILKKTREFPDDFSMRIDFGYLKNDTMFFPWSLSSTGIRHQKLIKVDSENNKMYIEYSSNKYANVLSFNNNQTNKSFTFFQNYDDNLAYLNNVYTFKNIEQTIDNGKRIGVKKNELELY